MSIARSRLVGFLLKALPLFTLASLVGCGGPALTPQTAAALPPRDLLSLAGVERDEGGEIVKLTFYHSDVSDVELRQLATLGSLRELSMQECVRVTDEGLSVLPELATLKTVKLLQVAITDDGLKSLGKLPAIEELVLGHTQITGSGLVHLSETSLARLKIHSNRVTPEGLAEIPQLRHLRQLEFHCRQLRLEDLPPFTPLANLESLVLSRTPLGSDGLSRLTGLPKLKRLLLDASDVTDEHLPILNSLAALEELELINARISNDGLEQLGLPSLRSISLDGCTGVSDAGLANLRGLTSLETLNLYNTSVTGRNLTGLAVVPSLRKVIMSGAQFRGNEQSISALKKLLPECEIQILRG